MMESEDNRMEFCLECGSSHLTETIVKHDFQYGSDMRTGAVLSTVVPVFHCERCNFAFTDYRAEEARAKVISEYLQSKAMR
jgi:hypothetical protein